MDSNPKHWNWVCERAEADVTIQSIFIGELRLFMSIYDAVNELAVQWSTTAFYTLHLFICYLLELLKHLNTLILKMNIE